MMTSFATPDSGHSDPCTPSHGQPPSGNLPILLWLVKCPSIMFPENCKQYQEFSYNLHFMLEPVMTTLRKVSDFVYFLPFLFSLYHLPEPSGMFYDSPSTRPMMYTLDYSSMM